MLSNIGKLSALNLGFVCMLLAGCINDTGDLITSASTSGTTAYLIGEAEEDDLARARDFADQRAVALRRDAASGGGEHVETLAALLGEPDHQVFAQWMQQNYAVLYAPRTESNALIDRIVAMR